MKKNSTFGILKRTSLVVSIILAVIVLARVAFALASLQQHHSWRSYEEQPSFWDYFVGYTDHPGIIAFSLLGGVLLTGCCAAVVCIIWVVVNFILHGLVPEDEKPEGCPNRTCPCVAHRVEVFIDDEWAPQECKDPNCTRVFYHHNLTFNKKTQSWER